MELMYYRNSGFLQRTRGATPLLPPYSEITQLPPAHAWGYPSHQPAPLRAGFLFGAKKKRRSLLRRLPEEDAPGRSVKGIFILPPGRSLNQLHKRLGRYTIAEDSDRRG